MKAYTLYFYSQSGSCITHFSVDGRSKDKVLKMGKEIAKIIFTYYATVNKLWLTKVTVEAEEYKPKAKQEPAKRFILDMNNIQLPSGFQLRQNVSVVFPGNATLHNCKIVRVSFTEYSEPLYDVEVPFHNGEDSPEPDWMKGDSVSQHDSNCPPKKGFFRLHGVRQWFLSYCQKDWDRMQEHDEAKGKTSE